MSVDVTAIPFVGRVGIDRTHEGVLRLPFEPGLHNHLGTIHASAQFTLAETASGDALQQFFPELVGKVVPVLRDSQMKFRKPATSALFAFPALEQEALTAFRAQFARKQRATVSVAVEVRDAQGVVTATGLFEWFVQGLPATG